MSWQLAAAAALMAAIALLFLWFQKFLEKMDKLF